MKLKLDILKKNKYTIGQSEGHNSRLHVTESQLPERAWITPQGHHSIMPFKPELLAKAKKLAEGKRHDSVLAVEFVFQVGNQTEWREIPDAEHPEGRRKSGSSKLLNALTAGVKASVIAEFGEDRILSIDLHTDESSPHIHVLFVPIHEGKLQAKKWTGGTKACGFLREKLHAVLNEHIPCTYTKGEKNGAPHDPSKAAGAVNGPQPAPTLMQKAAEVVTNKAEIKTLRQAIEALNRKVQTLFSKLKVEMSKVKEAHANAKLANEKAKAAVLSEQKARREIELLQRRVKQLEPFEPINKPVQKRTFTDGLTPRLSSKPSIPKPQ